MSNVYYGPASELTLADGTVVKPGDEVALDEATQKALEASGHAFSSTATETAPQSAIENLAEEGTTPEAQAQAAGLSVEAPQPATAPQPAPAPPPVPPVPPTPPAPPAPQPPKPTQR